MSRHDASVRRLAGVPAAALGGVLTLLAGAWLLSGRGEWGWGVVAGAVAVVAALAASVPVLIWAVRGGPRRGPMRVLLAGVVRLIVALSLSVLAVASGDYPPVATFFTVIPLYLLVMAMETRVLLNTRWPDA